MSIDDRARSAARELRQDVQATGDPQAALETVVASPRRTRRPWAAVAAAVLVVSGVVGATVLFSADADDGEQVSTKDRDTDQPAPSVSDFRVDPGPAGPSGAPSDGRDSLRLPVTVEPSTGLSPGDTVTVTGEGFTPGETVGIVLCGGLEGDETVYGADACDIGPVTYAEPDAEGRAQGTFVLTRLVTTPALGTVDCGAPTARCAMAMGQVTDYDVSGFAPITFRSDLPELVPPEMVVSPDAGLAHGDPITVAITGLTSPVGGIAICRALPGRGSGASPPPVAPPPAPGDPCWYYPVGVLAPGGVDGQFDPGLVPDAEGRVEVTLRAWRTYATPGGETVDCVVEQCVLRVSTVDSVRLDGLSPPAVPLSFDPESPAPVAPRLTVTPTEGLVPGDVLTVTAEGLEPGLAVDVVGCTDLANGATCGVVLATLVADEGGRATVTFAASALDVLGADCTVPGTCAISLGPFVRAAGGGVPTAPVVPPEPVPVTFR